MSKSFLTITIWPPDALKKWERGNILNPELTLIFFCSPDRREPLKEWIKGLLTIDELGCLPIDLPEISKEVSWRVKNKMDLGRLMVEVFLLNALLVGKVTLLEGEHIHQKTGEILGYWLLLSLQKLEKEQANLLIKKAKEMALKGLKRRLKDEP